DLAFTRRIERLAQGQPFEVELIDRNRNMPEEVRIEYRYAAESGGERIEREPMRPIGDVMTARKDRVVQSFEYRADGGDDHKMPWTHVDVVEPPRIRSLEILLHPPDYTGWPVRPAERRIVGLRGTTVEVHATTTKPLSAVVLHQQHGSDVVAQLTADGRGFVIPARAPSNTKAAKKLPDKSPESGKQPPAASLVIDASGAYWFELRDRDGLVAGPEDRWEIQAISDQPPSVNLQQPANNLLVTPNAVISIKVSAKDDLAIHTIDLTYTRSDHTEIGETAIRLFTGPDHAAPEPVVSAGQSRPGQSEAIDYAWDLAPLKIPPGTQVLLTAAAADYRPQSGTSAPRRLTVITPQELEDHLAQRESLVFNELARILKMQQSARLETTALETALDRNGRLQKLDVDQLRGDELSQRQVRRSLTSPTEGVRVQIVGLLNELESNKVVNLELQRRMQIFADQIERLDREELPAIESQLTAALKTADVKASPAASARQALREAGTNQDGVAAALEQMLGQLGEWNSVRGLSRELIDIRREQAAIEKETKDLGAQTLTKDPQDLTTDQLSELRKLSIRQLDLGRRFEKLDSRMAQVAEQIRSSDQASADAISDAMRAGRDQGISGLMRDAGAGIEQNHVGQSLGQQAAARRGLDEMLDILANRHEQELARLVKKLREAETQLAGLRKQQDGLQKKIKDAGEQKDEHERRKELERLSRQQRELAAEVDRLTRQLQRLQADKAAVSLSQASQQMDRTSKSASGGDSGGAEKAGEAAAKDLDDAQQKLAEARRKAENDLATEQLARLGDALKGLVDRQQHVIDETLRLEKLRAASGSWSRGQSQSLHDLSRDQTNLADETSQLAEKLAGAETFHFVLDAAAREMTTVGGRLANRDCSPTTQQMEQNVLSRLKQLVEATKEDKPPPGDSQAGEGSGGGSKNGAQSGGSIRALAELKLIRLMQD
ncbi:MAG TPA: hypothetical protein VGH32_11695, partial [Pirellulales bacterium]